LSPKAFAEHANAGSLRLLLQHTTWPKTHRKNLDESLEQQGFHLGKMWWPKTFDFGRVGILGTRLAP
jgi:hypothetical protein